MWHEFLTRGKDHKYVAHVIIQLIKIQIIQLFYLFSRLYDVSTSSCAHLTITAISSFKKKKVKRILA